jgi:hypothetical protein
MTPVVGFPLATTALKMSDYRLDSKAPMPFGALSSTGWDSIRVTIGDASAQLPK